MLTLALLKTAAMLKRRRYSSHYGCLCCTLSNDLALQLGDLADTEEFDYIIIEASGICEPIPITYNISAFCNQSQHATNHSHLNLDNIVAVVDCARMFEEFHNGADLLDPDMKRIDIETCLFSRLSSALRWYSTRPIWLLQSSFTSSRRLFEACRKTPLLLRRSTVTFQ